jgi:hypothetical protein
MFGTPFKPSICSYTGTFNVTLDTAFKIPTSNSMSLTYSIDPVDPLLVLNNGSTDFTALVSYPGYDIVVRQATLNPETRELEVQMDYFEHLQDQEITLQVSPPDVPQAFMVPNITSLWKVQSTNQLAVLVYSYSDYQELNRIATLANLLVYAMLLIMALTLVFRKFIGLELASLIQFGYLSLLQNK